MTNLQAQLTNQYFELVDRAKDHRSLERGGFIPKLNTKETYFKFQPSGVKQTPPNKPKNRTPFYLNQVENRCGALTKKLIDL